MTEDALIAGCLTGSNRHFDELYNKYASLLYAICLRYARDADEANDVLQEGFIKVFQQLKSFDPEKGSFEGWLKRVFINLSIDNYRRKQKMLHTISTDMLGDEMPDEDDDDLQGISISEGQILELIQELPPGFRTVFNLFAVEKMKHKEIADALGISESTSKTQYIRAKKIMQKKITQFYTIHQVAVK
jgi:RNA polymerase sigma factor (sigma-70 family)